MWKYRNTNEMYADTNTHIYHSDVYLGEDFSDGLKHYKYIKKERKNGRWVYYYNDDVGNKLSRNQTLAAFDLVSTGAYKRNKDSIDFKRLDRSISKSTPVFKKGGSYTINSKDAHAIAEYADATRKYNSYRLKSFPQRVAAFVAVNTLNTVSSGISKGKKLLSKIFGWR
jgi:hypothetical protein